MQNLPRRKIKNKPASTATLYRMAKRSGVSVCAFDMKHSDGLSLMNERGECFIGLSPRLTEQDERMVLAHELGHCMRGAFYTEQTLPPVRGKCEYKADKWAIEHLLPREALLCAIYNGIEAPDELAEYFELPERFVRKALDHYASVESMK